MSSEGIWTTEVYGAFGWENRGVFTLENGRVIGGDNRQYTMGTYKLSGDDIEAELTVYYYGPPRTAFGEASEQFTTKLVGKFEDGVIDGKINRPDKPKYDIRMRLTKRMDLPKG